MFPTSAFALEPDGQPCSNTAGIRSCLVDQCRLVYSKPGQFARQERCRIRNITWIALAWPSSYSDGFVVGLQSQGDKDPFPESVLPFLGLYVQKAAPSDGCSPGPGPVSLEILALPQQPQTAGGWLHSADSQVSQAHSLISSSLPSHKSESY